MATEYYSTPASLNARASSQRIVGWIDFDGDDAADAATEEAGFKFGRNMCRNALVSKYGRDVIDLWDSDTVPSSVAGISDDFCIWFFVSTNPALASNINRALGLYHEALEQLKALGPGGDLLIYEADTPEIEISTADVLYRDCTSDTGYRNACGCETS